MPRLVRREPTSAQRSWRCRPGIPPQMNPLTENILHLLRTPEGGALLAAAAECAVDPFAAARLRVRFPGFSAEEAGAAVDQIRLRRRAREKFTTAEQMWFSGELLEQASSEPVAAWRARRFAEWARTRSLPPVLADLCCGLGADTLGLARALPEDLSVMSVDRSPLAAALTIANAEALCLQSRIQVQVGTLPQQAPPADALWMDPSRRDQGKRTRALEAMSPSLGVLLTLADSREAIGIKLSPATDLDALNAQLAGRQCEREWISDRGVCRELVLWLGDLARERSVRRASLAGAGETLAGIPQPLPPAGAILRFLLEPDPALIRSGLVGNLAETLGAGAIDPQLAYLTLDRLVHTSFAVSYRVEDVLPFSLRELARRLRERNAGGAEIKTRGAAVVPETLRQQLRPVLKHGNPGCRPVVFITRLGCRPTMILGERVDLDDGNKD